MADTKISERRAAPRRAADWRVLLGPHGQLERGFLADISPTGASIVTEHPYETGAEIEVHFGIEEDHPWGRLRIRGVVRHCNEGKIGVQFVHADPTERGDWWNIIRGAA
jgi:hypothetical protein